MEKWTRGEVDEGEVDVLKTGLGHSSALPFSLSDSGVWSCVDTTLAFYLCFIWRQRNTTPPETPSLSSSSSSSSALLSPFSLGFYPIRKRVYENWFFSYFLQQAHLTIYLINSMTFDLVRWWRSVCGCVSSHWFVQQCVFKIHLQFCKHFLYLFDKWMNKCCSGLAVWI